MKKTTILLLGSLLILIGKNSYAQSTPNPCDFPSVECGTYERNWIINSFKSDTINYAPVGRSMPFWFAIGDTVSGGVDTTSTAIFNLTSIAGPGVLTGSYFTDENYYAYYDDIFFTSPGVYQVLISEAYTAFLDTIIFIVPEEENFCLESPAGDCVIGGGNKIIANAHRGIIVPVDAVIPEIITVGVIDSTIGLLDSTYKGTIYVEKDFGPGVVYGSLSMTGERWFPFSNLLFSEEGLYRLKFYELDSLDIAPGYIDVEVTGLTNTPEITLNNLTIYPNPFKDIIQLDFNHALEDGLIRMYNLFGQVISEQILDKTSKQFNLNTTFLEEGVYFISILDKGKIIDSGKVIKVK